eukprot:CAMPEP_0184537644 /NCGR_PEP_ID=MMETSP0198_2-20121128/17151_1 /TAXON_ID=1112570 /ORGANISM="Thraustochytrium sp., Strain LLF1b" /LENGTH=75 /DNA_ID=CAMNT_0026931003 /DNA_START=241 /DNA_END=464 /DNA_ORIENTATION=+
MATLAAVGDLVGNKVDQILNRFEIYQNEQQRLQRANLNKLMKNEAMLPASVNRHRLQTFLNQEHKDSVSIVERRR